MFTWMKALPTNPSHFFSESEWSDLAEVLPKRASTGRPRANDRHTVAAILFVLGSGCRWADLPPAYGSYVTAWRRYRGWSKDGIWARVRSRFLAHRGEQAERWRITVEANPRSKAYGVISGREIWVEPCRDEAEDEGYLTTASAFGRFGASDLSRSLQSGL